MYSIRVNAPASHKVYDTLYSLVPPEGKWALCQEKSDTNLHCHVFLQTDVTMQTIRNKIRSYDLKGNSDFSISKIKDEKKYLAYILKEDVDPDLQGFTDEFISESRLYDLSKKEKVSKAYSRLTQLRDYLESKYELRIRVPIYRDSICQSIIQFHLDNSYQIRRNSIRDYYDHIMCSWSLTYQKDLVKEIFKFS